MRGNSIFIFLFQLLFSIQICHSQVKINGVNFEGPPKPVSDKPFLEIKSIDANHVAIIPFAYGNSGEAKLSWKNLDWQWWGESAEGLKSCLQSARSKGLQTMVKPQVWFDRGSFTGHFKLENDQQWQQFEKDYRDYILHCAQIAAEEKASIFCIGTEFCAFVEARPQFWKQLITDVRKIFSGKITYAANWDTYDKCSLWSQVDYIGIDAYFPLSKHQTPSVKSLLLAWEPWFRTIKSISLKSGKPVLFTEYGYRSTDACCESPWDSSRGKEINLDAQTNALQALYQKFWAEPWFAGGFIWKWHDEQRIKTQHNDNFSPQHKPALEVVKYWYGKH
jgi:hypothetical protein